MSSKDLALSAALRLFNEQGSHTVSTNHIAEAAHISVGNLYYHFKSKNEIIVSLFHALNRAWQTRLNPPSDAAITWPVLEALITEHFQIVWEFRFFYREHVSLRHGNPTLARLWLQANRRGRSDMSFLLRAFAQTQGVTLSEPALQQLTDNCWIIADFWLIHREMRSGAVRRSDLGEAVELFSTTMQSLLKSACTQAHIATPQHASP